MNMASSQVHPSVRGSRRFVNMPIPSLLDPHQSLLSLPCNVFGIPDFREFSKAAEALFLDSSPIATNSTTDSELNTTDASVACVIHGHQYHLFKSDTMSESDVSSYSSAQSASSPRRLLPHSLPSPTSQSPCLSAPELSRSSLPAPNASSPSTTYGETSASREHSNEELPDQADCQPVSLSPNTQAPIFHPHILESKPESNMNNVLAELSLTNEQQPQHGSKPLSADDTAINGPDVTPKSAPVLVFNRPMGFLSFHYPESSGSPSQHVPSRRNSTAASSRLSFEVAVQPEPLPDIASMDKTTSDEEKPISRGCAAPHSASQRTPRGSTTHSRPSRFSRGRRSSHNQPGFTVVGRSDRGTLICAGPDRTYALYFDIEQCDIHDGAVQCSPDGILDEILDVFGDEPLQRHVGVQTDPVTFPTPVALRGLSHREVYARVSQLPSPQRSEAPENVHQNTSQKIGDIPPSTYNGFGNLGNNECEMSSGADHSIQPSQVSSERPSDKDNDIPRNEEINTQNSMEPHPGLPPGNDTGINCCTEVDIHCQARTYCVSQEEKGCAETEALSLTSPGNDVLSARRPGQLLERVGNRVRSDPNFKDKSECCQEEPLISPSLSKHNEWNNVSSAAATKSGTGAGPDDLEIISLLVDDSKERSTSLSSRSELSTDRDAGNISPGLAPSAEFQDLSDSDMIVSIVRQRKARSQTCRPRLLQNLDDGSSHWEIIQANSAAFSISPRSATINGLQAIPCQLGDLDSVVIEDPLGFERIVSPNLEQGNDVQETNDESRIVAQNAEVASGESLFGIKSSDVLPDRRDQHKGDGGKAGEISGLTVPIQQNLVFKTIPSRFIPQSGAKLDNLEQSVPISDLAVCNVTKCASGLPEPNTQVGPSNKITTLVDPSEEQDESALISPCHPESAQKCGNLNVGNSSPETNVDLERIHGSASMGSRTANGDSPDPVTPSGKPGEAKCSSDSPVVSRKFLQTPNTFITALVDSSAGKRAIDYFSKSLAYAFKEAKVFSPLKLTVERQNPDLGQKHLTPRPQFSAYVDSFFLPGHDASEHKVNCDSTEVENSAGVNLDLRTLADAKNSDEFPSHDRGVSNKKRFPGSEEVANSLEKIAIPKHVSPNQMSSHSISNEHSASNSSAGHNPANPRAASPTNDFNSAAIEKKRNIILYDSLGMTPSSRNGVSVERTHNLEVPFTHNDRSGGMDGKHCNVDDSPFWNGESKRVLNCDPNDGGNSKKSRIHDECNGLLAGFSDTPLQSNPRPGEESVSRRARLSFSDGEKSPHVAVGTSEQLQHGISSQRLPADSSSVGLPYRSTHQRSRAPSYLGPCGDNSMDESDKRIRELLNDSTVMGADTPADGNRTSKVRRGDYEDESNEIDCSIVPVSNSRTLSINHVNQVRRTNAGVSQASKGPEQFGHHLIAERNRTVHGVSVRRGSEISSRRTSRRQRSNLSPALTDIGKKIQDTDMRRNPHQCRTISQVDESILDFRRTSLRAVEADKLPNDSPEFVRRQHPEILECSSLEVRSLPASGGGASTSINVLNSHKADIDLNTNVAVTDDEIEEYDLGALDMEVGLRRTSHSAIETVISVCNDSVEDGQEPTTTPSPCNNHREDQHSHMEPTEVVTQQVESIDGDPVRSTRNTYPNGSIEGSLKKDAISRNGKGRSSKNTKLGKKRGRKDTGGRSYGKRHRTVLQAQELEREEKSSAEAGPRRSKRQRIPRLKYWKNEQVRYERRLSQALPTIAQVVLDVHESESDDEPWLLGRR